MKLSTFVALVFGLALLLGGTFFSIRLVSLAAERDQAESALRDARSENVRLQRELAKLGTPQATIAELKQRIAALQSELALAKGDSFEDVWNAFLGAVERQREAQGIDYEREVVARHDTQSLIARLASFGKEHYDDLEPWLERIPEEGKPLHREHRQGILDVLFQMDPERAFERARILAETERENTALRLIACDRLRQHDPERALPILLGILDYQAGKPPSKFENLAQLVDIVGEIGLNAENARVEAMMRRIAVEPTWEMAARNKALVWIGRLDVQEAWPELMDMVRTPSSNHYTKLKVLQTMRVLDGERAIRFIDALLNDEKDLPLDPNLRKAAGEMATQIRQEIDHGRPNSPK